MADKLQDWLIKFTFPHECVFMPGHHGDLNFVRTENVSGDTGGLTKWGIDQASHPNVNISTLTMSQAIDIYRKDYWNKCKCEELMPPLCFVVFDIAVNNGAHRAAIWLQETTRVKQDGFIGPITIGAANKDPQGFALNLIIKREVFYRAIAQQSSKTKFLQGWLNRNRDLSKAIV